MHLAYRIDKMPRAPKEHRRPDEVDADERLLNKLTTKGKKIMPVSVKKYMGTVQSPRGGHRWRSKFGRPYIYIGIRSHDTMEEAITRIKDENKKRSLHIRNVIYEYNGQYYCLLTQGKIMKFSYQHIGIVETHIWYAMYSRTTKSFYAYTSQNGTHKSYPKIVLHDMKENEIGDHANGDSLDNNIENIRAVPLSIQNRNKRKFSNNKSGTTGVRYTNINYPRWVSQWIDENGKQRTKVFSIKKYGDQAKSKAIEYRKKIEMSLESYREALSHRSR